MDHSIRFQASQERRGFGRRPCRAAVRVSFDPDGPEDWFCLEAADLSAQSVFLSADLLFPVGDWLELEFDVPGRAAPIRSQGQIVRANAARRSPAGMALLLPGLTDEERAALGRIG